MKSQLGSVCIGVYLARRGLAFVAASGPVDDPDVLACRRVTRRANPFAAARVLDPEAARDYLIEVERDVLDRVRTAFDEFMVGVTKPGFSVAAAAIPRPSQPTRGPLVHVLETERMMRGAEERLFLRACRITVKAIALPWLEYNRSHVFSDAAAQAGLTERDFTAVVRSRRSLAGGTWSRDLQAACAAALLASTCVSQPTTPEIDQPPRN